MRHDEFSKPRERVQKDHASEYQNTTGAPRRKEIARRVVKKEKKCPAAVVER
jgi:hypothetical protein